MSAIKALARRLDADRRMRETMTAPSPEGGYRVLRHRLRLDPVSARRMADAMPQGAAPPAQPLAPVLDDLMRRTRVVYVPASDTPAAPAAAVPASTPTPALATSKPPAELVFGRDIDGRMTTAMVADQEFRFQRDREGRIESAVSDRQIIKYQRDHAGNIVGARRLESKE